ncbi:hypothetical protein N7524_005976 [Penicillium chrysogenum]|nr:hypothetical protein N7524_005976 [Penicillium chrysogenum]
MSANSHQSMLMAYLRMIGMCRPLWVTNLSTGVDLEPECVLWLCVLVRLRLVGAVDLLPSVPGCRFYICGSAASSDSIEISHEEITTYLHGMRKGIFMASSFVLEFREPGRHQ